MKIEKIQFDQPTVIVLGAGATRGASFVDCRMGVLPPLDSDFFTQAQRLSSAKPHDLIEGLIEDVVNTFGTNFRLTMEGYLTQIEHLKHVYKDYKLAGTPQDNPYDDKRERFMQTLAAVMDEAIGRHPNCKYHKTLSRYISAEDTILSFNYDWLMDIALRDNRGDIWNPRKSYGVEAYIKGEKGKGTSFWASRENESALFPEEYIYLLKMHGSMNWFPQPSGSKEPRLQLRQRWWHQNGKLKFEIIPPEWNKPIRSGLYAKVWRKAREEMADKNAIAFIGYSLPHTDLPAKALFMVDAGSDGEAPDLDLLIIANPDAEARERIRTVLNKRINHRTRVLSFDYFSEFAGFMRSD